MEAHSIKLREVVLKDCDAGMLTHDVALKHGVSKSWVRRVKQRRRETGEIKPRPPIKKTPPKWHAWKERIIALIQQEPDLTLRELRDELSVETSLQTLSVALRQLKYTLKKKSSVPRSRTGRTSR
jgi:transposase